MGEGKAAIVGLEILSDCSVESIAPAEALSGGDGGRVGGRLGRRAAIARSCRLDNPCPYRQDPFVLQKLHGGRSVLRILHEATLQEVDPLGAELIRRRKLGWVALRDVIHNGPFVIQVGPRSSARGHFEDDASQRPNVHGAKVSRILALNDFR